MKITIEHEYGSVTVTDTGCSVETAVQSCYYALLATGFSPRTVAEWMIERGEMELQALGVCDSGTENECRQSLNDNGMIWESDQ